MLQILLKIQLTLSMYRAVSHRWNFPLMSYAMLHSTLIWYIKLPLNYIHIYNDMSENYGLFINGAHVQYKYIVLISVDLFLFANDLVKDLDRSLMFKEKNDNILTRTKRTYSLFQFTLKVLQRKWLPLLLNTFIGIYFTVQLSFLTTKCFLRNERDISTLKQ